MEDFIAPPPPPPNTKCSVLANFDYFCWPDTSDRIFLQSWISFTHRDGKVPMKKVSKRRLLKYKTKNPRQTVIRTWTWGNGWIRLDVTVMQLRCHVSSVHCAATRGRRRFEFQDICFVVCNWGLKLMFKTPLKSNLITILTTTARLSWYQYKCRYKDQSENHIQNQVWLDLCSEWAWRFNVESVSHAL